MKRLVLVLSAVLLCQLGEGAKILFYPAGHCTNSHLMNMERLASFLSHQGHEAHMLINSDYAGPRSRMDFSHVKIIRFQAPHNVPTHCQYRSIQAMLDHDSSAVFRTFMNMVLGYCEALLKDTKTLQQLKKENYDLVIVDSIDFCSPIITDFIDKPFILLLSGGTTSSVGLEGPTPYSYVPAAISPFSHKMTLAQRFINTGIHLLLSFMSNYVFLPAFQELRHKYNMNASLSLSATYGRASFKIVNGDFALDYPMPVMPAAVMAGSFFVRPAFPLTGDLADFMDDAVNGVVIVSFGSIVQRFDDHWAEMFAEALAKLPQKVLWKFQGNTPQKLGNNTKLMSWLPQTDILAHPNTKLFITHGGLNSATETTYYGVPVVVIPIFGDQPYQATKLTEHAKIGVKLNIKTLTAHHLHAAIQSAITEPSFKKNAAHLSTLLRDKPLSDGDQILYWVDYVIRHQGASHLKSEAVNLRWYQKLLLDVTAVIILVLIVVLYVLYQVIRAFYLSICHYDCFLVKFKFE